MVPAPARLAYPISSVVLRIAISCVIAGNSIFCQFAFADDSKNLNQATGNSTAQTMPVAPISLVDNQATPPFQVTNLSHDQNKILDLKPLYLISAVQPKSAKYLL